MSASDDSGDELKVKFTSEVCYSYIVNSATPGLETTEATQCSRRSAPSPIAKKTRSIILNKLPSLFRSHRPFLCLLLCGVN